MKTVLLTGAAGFIGSNLTEALLGCDYRVVGVDNLDPSYNPVFKKEHLESIWLHKNFKFYQTDIRELAGLAEIWRREKPVYLVHLAAKADTREAVRQPLDYLSVNITGSVYLLELCRERGVENIILASSSSVYGNEPRQPWREDYQADRPLSPYGASKRAMELLAHSYHHNFNLPITILRYFNIYGENNRPGMVPYIWTDKILRGEAVEISGDGSRRRDYTYVGDAVEATIKALEKPLGFEILNIGNNQPVSLKKLLATLEQVIGRSVKVHHRPEHQASVESTCADVAKAGRLLGWHPQVSLTDGLAKLVKWFRQRRLKDFV